MTVVSSLTHVRVVVDHTLSTVHPIAKISKDLALILLLSLVYQVFILCH